MKSNGGRKPAVETAASIKLKAITAAERKRLRNPSYEYILP